MQFLLEAHFPQLVEGGFDYICSQGKKEQAEPTKAIDEDASIVNQTIEELAKFCSKQPLPKVNLILLI